MRRFRYTCSMNIRETMKCAIFDMDGTLLDSMWMWRTLGEEIIRTHGKTPAKNVWYDLKVLNSTETAQYFKDNYGFSESVENIIEEIDDTALRHYSTDLPLKPGAMELLQRLDELHVPAILATATDKRLVRACLHRLGIEKYFFRLNSCEDFDTSKSQPLIFQKSAEMAGVPVQNAVVFEDSLYAIRTAHNAGFPVVAVYDTSAEDLSEPPETDWRRIVPLADITCAHPGQILPLLR